MGQGSGHLENMEHLYQCETFGKKPKLSFEQIYNGSIQEPPSRKIDDHEKSWVKAPATLSI